MRRFLALWKRELTACFLSPVAYVTMVVYLMATGGTFVPGIVRNEGTRESLTAILFSSLALWMTFLISVVTMRLFAEEKRSGTLESLMTAPVTDRVVVAGKYAGALSFVLIVAAPALSWLWILAWISPAVETVDPGALLGGCMILVLLSAFGVAAGLLVSLLTRSQIAAAICTLVALWAFLLAGALEPGRSAAWRTAARVFSVEAHLMDFARGLVDSRALVFYLTATVFLLFCSVRILETRRWL